ncbi:MAG TPA: MarR family transcriptional regulator [Syntrophomonas sp.]|nr:MarR family transcriptional regulator [Syntrophomonas sp.]
MTAKMIDKVYALINQISSENHEESAWLSLIENDFPDRYKELAGISLAECHVIDYIGRNNFTNATGISSGLRITKGGISKITARLLQRELIEARHVDGNKKEKLYSLTPSGHKVFMLHAKLHALSYDKIKVLMESFSTEELKIINRFLDGLAKAL